jgi:ribosomal protein L29
MAATIEELQADLTAIRAMHSEVLAKSNTRKTRITELEAELVTLKQQLADTVAAHSAESANNQKFIKKLFVDHVAEELASDISIAPHLIMPFILPRLTVANDTNGQPLTMVLDADGKTSQQSVADLSKELRENKQLAAIIIGSKASGGGATDSGRGSSSVKKDEEKAKVKPKAVHLGLR